MPNRSSGHDHSLPLLTIGPAFLAIAAWMIWGTTPTGAPDLAAGHGYPAAHTDLPERTPIGDPPVTMIAGFEKTCGDCHRLRETPEDVPSELTQHQDVVLNHGLNDRCLNCHSRENRDFLLLPGNQEIDFTRSAELCATCHGTTYRDWQHGTHGRTTGSWDRDDARYRRLTCVACHDPHSPAFGLMASWPGPHSLRVDPDHVTSHDPFADGHFPLQPDHLRRPAKEASH